MRPPAAFLILTFGAIPALAVAQTVPPPAAPRPPVPVDEPEDDGNDIIVQGVKPPGSVIGDIPPEQQLSPADIRSYGVGSITELLTELAPQLRSDRGSGGAPVVLLDGKRISGFSEIRDLPTEAIARVDILPEEVALKYGYRADQKVVNIVLRRRFRAATLELADRLATEGGRNAPQGELDLLKIARTGRVNLHLEYQAASALTEDERGIIAASGTAPAGTPDVADPGAYRTLLPATRNFSANAIYARSILGNVSATLNGTLSTSSRRGLLGLPTVDGARADDVGPLQQRADTVAAHLGTTLNGVLGTWQWSLTGTYDHSESKTFTDTGIDTGTLQAPLPTANVPAGNRAFSTSNDASVDALFTGKLFKLPAGDVSTSITIGGDLSDFSSRSNRADPAQSPPVSRDIVNGQVNLDVPIASRAKNVLGVIGSLSVNFNGAVDHLSDFGTLTTLGYGLNWSPVTPLRLIASVTDQDTAPSPQQLGNPQIVTPGVRVFDYVRGENAVVTIVSGGNAALNSDSRHTVKVGATLKPWAQKDITLTANYVDARIDGPIVGFPSASAAIEAAFPGRFTRDVGVLQRIDTRPINFAVSSRSELRWGINFSTRLKSKLQKQFEAFREGKGPNPLEGLVPPGGRRFGGGDGGGGQGRRGGEGNGAQGARGGGGGFGGGAGRGGGQAGGRLNFALYHTWHFTDRVLVQQNGPALDLLRGDAIGSSGGQSRHELEGQAGYNNNGLGARLSVNWQSATRVNGGTPGNPETLRFSGLGTANLRLFADLGQRLDLLKKHPWLRATRVTFGIENVFDARQRVTDAAGVTPIAYQPGYLNPLGRTIRLTLRKQFF